ncbi:hypothetical protein P170DRAFT_422485 [Aspergillus steynii IBT 23096]|uniref:Uncharacterized protein n=1 Tax=Aspergillus steynii IBT 23096 TaxID=1392250 RepID=A0A2I2GF10_9EURO|nr:uncharacterized protein P170DRAFT_422485 [Aspergillus steynii IBT 23096]PLB51474.1 hypothetical protein P170DRAFT_422485 [Aspergillus steynii IBT 23096]
MAIWKPSRRSPYGKQRKTILINADEFITKYELHHICNVLRKGTLLAHDPNKASHAEKLPFEGDPFLRDTIAAKPPSIRSLLRCVLFVIAAPTYTLLTLEFWTQSGWTIGPNVLDDAWADGKTNIPWPELNVANEMQDKDRRRGEFFIKHHLVAMAQERLPCLVSLRYTAITVACFWCLDDGEDNVFGGKWDRVGQDGIIVEVRFIEKVLLQIEDLVV